MGWLPGAAVGGRRDGAAARATLLNLKSSVNANSSKGLNSNRLFRTSWASNLLLLHRHTACTCSCPSFSCCSLERGYLPALTCKTRASFDIFLALFFLSLALLSFFFSHATRRVDWHRVLTPRQPISCPILLRCFSCFCVALHGYRFAVLAVCFLNPFIKGATAFFAVAVNMIFRLRFSLFKYPVVHVQRGNICGVCVQAVTVAWEILVDTFL